MGVNRSRIIVYYKDKDFLKLLENKNNIDLVYEGSESGNYAIIYCDFQDEKYLLETLSNDPSIIKAFIADERVKFYNF